MHALEKTQKADHKGCGVGVAHCVFLAQKNGQVGGGVQSSSNFSASVAITFKSPQSGSRQHESNVSQKEQTSSFTDICVGWELNFQPSYTNTLFISNDSC